MCCTCSQQLETDLKIEREWRQTLQNDLHRERDSVAQLSTEALQINGLKKVRWGKINSGQDAMFFLKCVFVLMTVHISVYLIYVDPFLFLLPFDWFFQEFHRLQDENVQLKTICEDQEKALEELGSKLSEYANFILKSSLFAITKLLSSLEGGEAMSHKSWPFHIFLMQRIKTTLIFYR